MKNNEANSKDLQIIQVIEASEKYEPIKVIKSSKIIKKEHLIATLGFFNNLSFPEAKKRYQSTKIDALIGIIVSKFNRLLPDLCGLCSNLYDPDNQDIGACCFLCDKALCPECCPKNQNTEGFCKILFPICMKCVEEKHKPTDEAPSRVLNIYTGPATGGSNINTGPSNGGTNIHTGPSNGGNIKGGPSNEESNLGPSNTSQTNSKVCKHYLNKRCKYYNTDQQCKFSHPKLCNQWT